MHFEKAAASLPEDVEELVSAGEEESEGLRASDVRGGDEAGREAFAEIHAEMVREGDVELVDACDGEMQVS